MIGLFPYSQLEIPINHDVMHLTKGAFPVNGNQTSPRCLPARSVRQAVPTDISALTEVMAHAGARWA